MSRVNEGDSGLTGVARCLPRSALPQGLFLKPASLVRDVPDTPAEKGTPK